MRIKELVISNYRQYRDLRLDFTRPPKGGYDLNVLVGKNGFGKTNLANALCWCLWEREPDLALKDKNSGKPIFNLTAMEDNKAAEKKSILVSVSVKIELEDRSKSELLVNRNVLCHARGVVDEPKLALVRTCKSKPSVSLSGQEAQDEINRYYPSDLSDYLIFDGERLTTYFQTGQAAKIRQSVINLSGVQRLDEAIRHHENVLEELSGQMSNMSSEMSEIIERRDVAVAAWQDNKNEIERHEAELAKGRIRIAELKEQISGHENVPELIRERDKFADLLEGVERELSGVHDKKCELIRRYYPLLTVMEHVRTVRAYVSLKRKKNQFPPPIKREVFEEILKGGTCSVCGGTLSEESRKWILAQIDKYNQTVVSTETYNALTNVIEPNAIAFGERLKMYLESRDYILGKERDLLAQQDEISRNLQELNDKLSMVNDAEGFQSKVDELRRREVAQSRIRDLLGACRAKEENLLLEKNSAVADFDRMSMRNARDNDLRRKYEILRSSRIAIDEVRGYMLNEVREGIEKKANEYWKGLMWKPVDEIGTIRLNVNFQLSLMNGDQPLIGTLSAAERVMLALSITWAIHSQAGMNFPFFIDTPVSNMSSDSRKDFAVTLKEISASKQVVLLFTDTEYVADIPEAFGSDVNMYRTLSYARGVTNIK